MTTENDDEADRPIAPVVADERWLDTIVGSGDPDDSRRVAVGQWPTDRNIYLGTVVRGGVHLRLLTNGAVTWEPWDGTVPPMGPNDISIIS